MPTDAARNEVERNVLMYAELVWEIGNLLESSARSLHKISPEVARQAHQQIADCIEFFEFIERVLHDRASKRPMSQPLRVN
jgi:hypothetical protein